MKSILKIPNCAGKLCKLHLYITQISKICACKKAVFWEQFKNPKPASKLFKIFLPKSRRDFWIFGWYSLFACFYTTESITYVNVLLIIGTKYYDSCNCCMLTIWLNSFFWWRGFKLSVSLTAVPHIELLFSDIGDNYFT